MTTLPRPIQERFYQTITGDRSVEDFEQWVYADTELEMLLKPDDYVDLISLNYKTREATYELSCLLKKHIDLGTLETDKMLGRLREAQQKTERFPCLFSGLYNLYDKGGYIFIAEVVHCYYLLEAFPESYNAITNEWKDLTQLQRTTVVESFSPNLETELERVIARLEKGTIQLSGERDAWGQYGYIDLRDPSEC